MFARARRAQSLASARQLERRNFSADSESEEEEEDDEELDELSCFRFFFFSLRSPFSRFSFLCFFLLFLSFLSFLSLSRLRFLLFSYARERHGSGASAQHASVAAAPQLAPSCCRRPCASRGLPPAAHETRLRGKRWENASAPPVHRHTRATQAQTHVLLHPLAPPAPSQPSLPPAAVRGARHHAGTRETVAHGSARCTAPLRSTRARARACCFFLKSSYVMRSVACRRRAQQPQRAARSPAVPFRQTLHAPAATRCAPPERRASGMTHPPCRRQRRGRLRRQGRCRAGTQNAKVSMNEAFGGLAPARA